MIAIQIEINGETRCIAGSSSVLTTVAGIHGEQSSQEGVTLTVKGAVEEETAIATWLNQALVLGNEVQMKVVDVPESELTKPAEISRTNKELAQREEEKYYWRIKEKYEPESIQQQDS